MIPIEVLKKVSVVCTHAHCPDGMASAMILKDAFWMLGTRPRIEFLAHGTPEHRAAGRGDAHDGSTLFCDIAPHPEAVSRGEVWKTSTIVLDHHKGAEELVRSFGELGVFADEKLEPGVSGAVLAFREVWLPASKSICRHCGEELLVHEPGGLACPRWAGFNRTRYFESDRLETAPLELVRYFAECVGARDTWQTKDPRFQRGQWISKMLMSKPASYWFAGSDAPSSSILPHPPYLTENEIQAGRALFEAHEEAVRQAVDQCVRTLVGPVTKEGGAFLYVFQEQASGFRLTSDVSESIRKDFATDVHGIIAGFSYVVDKPGGEPRLLYSLRGLNGFDVAAFAKANSGGGHTAAAGFSVTLDACNEYGSPYDFIRRRLQEFLQ